MTMKIALIVFAAVAMVGLLYGLAKMAERNEENGEKEEES